MATFKLSFPALIGKLCLPDPMKFLVALSLLFTSVTGVWAPTLNGTESIAPAKRTSAPIPEADGLRLEVIAELEDVMTSTGLDWEWGGAYLRVDLALLNVSDRPITVPTMGFDSKPLISTWGPGTERIMISIEPVEFERSPTVFVASRYAPAVLAPGERVMIVRHRTSIKDRVQADATKEIYAVFSVSRRFDGPKEWWRGLLQTYSGIKRQVDPDKFIVEAKASHESYKAQKDAEQDPNYGAANAARIAALIAGSDQARIREEGGNKADEVIVNDRGWIKQVSAAIAAVPLPRSTHCLCIGWRTAYFYEGDQIVVSVAAKHGHQLRISWPGGGGDYPIDETHWKIVKQALELSQEAVKP